MSRCGSELMQYGRGYTCRRGAPGWKVGGGGRRAAGSGQALVGGRLEGCTHIPLERKRRTELAHVLRGGGLIEVLGFHRRREPLEVRLDVGSGGT